MLLRVALNWLLDRVSMCGRHRDAYRIALGLQRFLDTCYASLDFQSWERWVTTNGHTRIVEQSAGQGARLVKFRL